MFKKLLSVVLLGWLGYATAADLPAASTTPAVTTATPSAKLPYEILKFTTPEQQKSFADVKDLVTEPNKVVVLEFFSYGCPACYRFEPVLEKWLASKPANVTFKRVPVVFEEGWLSLATAYYTADKLQITEKISPFLFDAVWKQGMNLTDEDTVGKVFVAHGGVTADEFKQAYEFAPMIAAQVFRSQALMSVFKVDEIPTLIINGQYKTSVAMAGNADATVATLNELIAKIQHLQ